MNVDDDLPVVRVSRVHEILHQARTTGNHYTHVSMVHPNGSFNIHRQLIEDFWAAYCEDVTRDLHHNAEQDEKDQPVYGIAEKAGMIMPVLVDVDIKLPFTEDMDVRHLYSEDELKQVVEVYQSALATIIKGNVAEAKPQLLRCFVLEKPAYRVTSGDHEFIKSGFHLHFPYTFLQRQDHEMFLLPSVMEKMSFRKVFHHLGIEPKKLIDASYLRNPWLLYGSRKEGPNMEAYRLTKVYDHFMREMQLPDALADFKLFDLAENLIDHRGNELCLLPRILSIQLVHQTEVCEMKPNLPVHHMLMPRVDKRNSEIVAKNLTQELEKAKKFLQVMSPDRASTYSEWIQIGWALCNISEKSDAGLALWIEFSEKWQYYKDDTECISKWTTQFEVREEGVSIGTLSHFAKLDNPVEHKKILQQYSKPFLDQSLQGSHNDLAKALYQRYGQDFVCASLKPETWYYYTQHRWEKMEDGIFLRKKISDEMVQVFLEMRVELTRQTNESFNAMQGAKDALTQRFGDQLKMVDRMIANLKNTTFKTSVMRECRDEFYNKEFLNRLDKNAWLIGFRNGVYDLQENHFRPGVPEDYLSLQMPIDYVDYEEKDQVVQDVHDFFVKIFPDRDIRNYFLDVSSEVFVGGNKRKHVYFWSGEGDNGKSVTQLFFEKMFGQYAIKLPTSLVVGKRTGSSQATPELARAGNGVRWAILQEPDKRDVLNIGIIKELSGNDSFFARGLFEAGREIEPMFKLAVICNDPPSIPYSDKATWNRIRVIPFESTFTDDPPASWEEQLAQKRFPKDPHFDKKIPPMIRAFAWVLLNHRKKNPTFVEPRRVRLATDLYRLKNDCYQQFMEENVVKDGSSRIVLSDIYEAFKSWYREGFPGEKVPVKGEVKEYFSRKWGDPERGMVWKGFRLSMLEDEVEAGAAMVITDNQLTDEELASVPVP